VLAPFFTRPCVEVGYSSPSFPSVLDTNFREIPSSEESDLLRESRCVCG